MRTETFPLAMPEDLMREVRETATEKGLSLADAIRQSISLGLPKLREQSSMPALKPFTEQECRLAFETPNPDFDALEHHCANLPKRLPEE